MNGFEIDIVVAHCFRPLALGVTFKLRRGLAQEMGHLKRHTKGVPNDDVYMVGVG